MAPSLGERSPGLLLERYETYCQQNIKNPDNRYLLVVQGNTRHNTPVSRSFVNKSIQRATLRVLDASCNPNT